MSVLIGGASVATFSGPLPILRDAELLLQPHVVDRRQPQTRTQDVLYAGSLLKECIDHRSPTRDEWSLAHVTQDGQHTVKRLEQWSVFNLESILIQCTNP